MNTSAMMRSLLAGAVKPFPGIASASLSNTSLLNLTPSAVRRGRLSR
jgi:hypothetical protein